MKITKFFLCEDNIEGIFTAIYNAWDSGYGHDNIRIAVQNSNVDMELELFSEYIEVETDDKKAEKVADSIGRKISENTFDMVCKAAWSHEPDKGDVIYRFLILGFHMGDKVINFHISEVVIKMFNMNRNVSNEAHNFLGFLRFSEIKNSILVSKINPQNDILRLIAPHFSERLNNENFIIYDERRKTAIVHRSGYPWIFTYADELDVDKLSNLSEQEEEFRALWQTFFNTIGIKERKNQRLQNNLLPKRFRSNMVNF